jgi:hypothetical protein
LASINHHYRKNALLGFETPAKVRTSRKLHQMAGFVFNTAAPLPPKPPDGGDQSNNTKKKLSFRDILTEGQELNHAKEKVDLIAKGLMKVSLEGGNRLLPMVTMDDTLFQDLCNPWKEALVIKLLGKNVGFNLMKDRLQKLWRLTGGFEIMDVDNGFYMVKCELLADREKIVSEGPWMLFDHYLAVARWTPDFASPHAKIERTLVWIRFPDLSLLYYDESVLLGLASVVGTPIKVDTNTLKVERGRFARVCVEIDLTMPVVGKVNVNGHWYNVQYEGLHIICGGCGCYGHHTRDCKKDHGKTVDVGQTEVTNGGRKGDNPRQPETPTEPNKEGDSGSLDTESATINETHGDWLVVQRRKNNNIKGKNSQPVSLAINESKNMGNKKGKEPNHSSKGVNENKSLGMGPILQKTNLKKRRLDKGGSLGVIHHFDGTRDPPVKGRIGSSTPHGQNVNKEMMREDGNIVSIVTATPRPMQTNVNTSNDRTTSTMHKSTIIEQVLKTNSNFVHEASAGTQNMEESKTQDEVGVPTSPIDWEQT